MFSKILIANRGEIACRVIDTCRRLGVRTVAVFSDADRASRHVAMADEAVHIGGAQVSESYLKADRLIEAAKRTGVEAIHPGFGFLSENPEFVEAVEAAGLVFIGPSAQSMRAMGLKDAAKALMEEAGVPVVPGYHGTEQDGPFLAGEADKIGYPVLIKARAGGGGKGMRKVDDPADFAEMLASAQREAQSSFGDDRVLIEKYINAPRHIEVQVFGDSHGTVVHLFERDCSLQRRHQKVIEEAPAPGMSDEMRAAMTGAAVRAAKAIDYQGAGTIEFIVDGAKMTPDAFWFMEMNTRLQVEHPVTEEITGVDLVEWQLRVAGGGPIPLAQAEISFRGHAFEARVYAEDAAQNFMPATGTLSHLSFPDHARIETGVRAGDTITAFYDPMIAKVITRGESRAEALLSLKSALAQTEITGCVTNVAFLSRLAADQDFAAGNVDTGLIARGYDALVEPVQPGDWVIALAALSASGAFYATDTGVSGFGAWSLWGFPTRPLRLKSGDEEIALRVSRIGDADYEISGLRETFRLSVIDFEPSGRVLIEHSGRIFEATIITDGVEITCFTYGNAFTFSALNGGEVVRGDAAASNVIVAPMPGVVTAASVTDGQDVKAGDTLIVMEAMKMEHALRAAVDGKVAHVNVATGDQVEKGDILVALEDE